MDSRLRTLRPMGLGDILDTTFTLYRQNFALFAGIVAVLVIPETVVSVAFTFASSSSGDFGTAITLAGLQGLLSLLFNTLITGALAQAISARYLGRPITILDAYGMIPPGAFLSLLVASILYAIVVGIGTIFLLIPGIYLAVRFLLLAQPIVLEGRGVGGAFSRSSELVRGSWWRVFGIAIVLYLLVAIISAAVGGAIGALLSLGGGTTARAVSTALTNVVRIFVLPIQLGGFTLLYYDLRIRKEGFDLEQLARSLEAPEPA